MYFFAKRPAASSIKFWLCLLNVSLLRPLDHILHHAKSHRVYMQSFFSLQERRHWELPSESKVCRLSFPIVSAHNSDWLRYCMYVLVCDSHSACMLSSKPEQSWHTVLSFFGELCLMQSSLMPFQADLASDRAFAKSEFPTESAMQIFLGTVTTIAGAAGGMYGIIQSSESKTLKAYYLVFMASFQLNW